MSVHEEMKGTLGTDPEIATKIRMAIKMETKMAIESQRRIQQANIETLKHKQSSSPLKIQFT